MNQLNESQFELHAKIVGWIRIVSSSLFLCAGLVLFILLTGIGFVADDRVALGVLSIVGTVVGGLLVLLGIPGILAGIGVLAHKSWGRVLTIIIGIIDLVNFPVGTLVGVYTIFVLMQDTAGSYFGAASQVREIEGQAS